MCPRKRQDQQRVCVCVGVCVRVSKMNGRLQETSKISTFIERHRRKKYLYRMWMGSFTLAHPSTELDFPHIQKSDPVATTVVQYSIVQVLRARLLHYRCAMQRQKQEYFLSYYKISFLPSPQLTIERQVVVVARQVRVCMYAFMQVFPPLFLSSVRTSYVFLLLPSLITVQQSNLKPTFHIYSYILWELVVPSYPQVVGSITIRVYPVI